MLFVRTQDIPTTSSPSRRSYDEFVAPSGEVSSADRVCLFASPYEYCSFLFALYCTEDAPDETRLGVAKPVGFKTRGYGFRKTRRI